MTEDLPTLLAIQVGQPRTLGDPDAADPFDREWTSAIFKEPVDEPVFVGREGIVGDGQADRIAHGGADKAVCAYASEHYPFWRDELGKPDLPFGAFGENFTVDGIVESEFCVGDVFRVGEAVVQISQPRTPCWKLARKWRVKTLTARVVETGFSGWYFRVLEEGEVAPGTPFELDDRPHPAWSLARANDVMHQRKSDAAAAAELAAIPVLAASWRETLERRASRA